MVRDREKPESTRYYIKDGIPEPVVRGGYGTFADIEQNMCRGHPRFCTVLLLGIAQMGFETFGHTSSKKFSRT